MAIGASGQVDVTALGPSTADAVLWQMQGRLHVTVIVKASFAFTPDAAMSRIDPEEIFRAEVHHNKNPMRSVRATGDLAPFQPRADVVLTGHACAPAGTTVDALSVRLVVFREGPLIEKTLYVRGDTQGTETTPFDRIPLMYERAFGGIGWEENPLGVGAGAATSAKIPNLFDPSSPRRVAGFGPISRGWPLRKRLLGQADRKALDRPIAEVPAGFDWAYYQSAPLDQRTDYLAGNEWIILDGMSPTHPHLQSYLPSARAVARVFGIADGGRGHLLALSADTLRIDADAMTCSVTWRGSFPAPGASALAGLRILAGVESAGHPIAWPDAAAGQAPAERSRAVDAAAAVPDSAATMMLQDDAEAPSRDRVAAPVEVVEPRASAPSAGRSATTEELVPQPSTSAASRWDGTLAIDQDLEEPRPAPLPFRAGQSQSLPPRTLRVRTPLEIAEAKARLGRTLTVEVGDAEAPRSLPFVQPMSAPPPARAFVEALSPTPEEAPARTPEAPARPAPKRATTGGVPIVNDTGLAFGAAPWGLTPSRDCLTVIAKATCDLVPGGPAVLRASADPLEGERFFDGDSEASCVYPTDFARFKVRADVVLTGHACAPKGAVTSLETRLAFGAEGNAFERRILVFGERRWEGTKATEPEPFVRMPLVHARAFGGPKFDPNPSGAGHPDRMRRGPLRLPNLEDPGRRLRTPKQLAAPACFAPIPRAWKDRWASRGRQREAWPCFPEDLDWTLFQAAPPAQQLAFLRGDEPFEISGLRADHPTLSGSLPGLRARCLATRRGETFEIPLCLDTVVFDLDAMKLHLVWRGAVGVVDERAPDLDALRLITESAAQDPAPIALPHDKGLRR